MTRARSEVRRKVSTKEREEIESRAPVMVRIAVASFCTSLCGQLPRLPNKSQVGTLSFMR